MTNLGNFSAKPVIYKITSPTGKIYIGSTIDFKKRIKHYSNMDCKGQAKLYSSIKKHGFTSHIIEIIEECSIDTMLEKERYYGNMYNVMSQTGLNLSLPGHGETKAVTSKETIERMRLAHSGERNYFYGKKHTEASRAKIKLACLNMSDQRRLNLRNAQLGKKVSLEARTKMSASQTGRRHSEETKEKMRLSSSNLKYVLCLQTGIFYNGTADAAEAYNINRSTLKNKLNGSKPNNTSLIYA